MCKPKVSQIHLVIERSLSRESFTSWFSGIWWGRLWDTILFSSLVAQRLSVCLECWRPGFDPWVRKIPWRRKWQPTPVLLPGESHGGRSLVGYSPWGRLLSMGSQRAGQDWATSLSLFEKAASSTTNWWATRIPKRGSNFFPEKGKDSLETSVLFPFVLLIKCISPGTAHGKCTPDC